MTTPAPTPVCTILSPDGVGMDQDGIPCSAATWTGELAYGPGLAPVPPTEPGYVGPEFYAGIDRGARPAQPPIATTSEPQELPVTGNEGTTAGLALVVCLLGVAFVRLARR